MEIRLNLIPEYKKEEIRKSKSLRFIIKEGFLLAFIFIFVFSGLFFFDYVLKINLNLVSNSAKMGSKKESFEKVKKLDDEFKKINETIVLTEKIQNSQFYWSIALMKLNDFVPGEVFISGISAKDYKITITGTSLSRDNLIDFRSRLEKESCISNIILPLSDLVTKDNSSFQLTFNLKKECLEKQL